MVETLNHREGGAMTLFGRLTRVKCVVAGKWKLPLPPTTTTRVGRGEGVYSNTQSVKRCQTAIEIRLRNQEGGAQRAGLSFHGNYLEYLEYTRIFHDSGHPNKNVPPQIGRKRR